MKKYIKETIKYSLRSPLVIRKHIREVEALCAMTHDEMKAYKDKRFLEILHKAYNCSAFYRRFYDDAGVVISDIKGIEDIGKLPILTKDMIREHAVEMLTEPKWKMVKAKTSGTTGTPLQVFETWPSLWREQAYLYCYRKRCGFTMGRDTIISLRGHLSAHEQQLWVRASKTQYLSSYSINNSSTVEYHKIILKRQPKAIEGYPNTLFTLACNMEQHGLSCNIPLCFTSSECLLDYQRQKIEKIFNTKIFDWYGMTERTILLYELPDHSGYEEAPGYSIVEYYPDSIITTSLINSGFPLIRYKANDVIEKDKNGKIIKILGRASAHILGTDGTTYDSAGLTYVLHGDLPIKYAQFVQYPSGHIDFNVVPLPSFKSKETLIQQLQRLIELKIDSSRIDMSINIVDESYIVYTQSGKFNFVVQKKK